MAVIPKATIRARDEIGLFDWQTLVADHKADIDTESLAVYCCGPETLLCAVEDDTFLCLHATSMSNDLRRTKSTRPTPRSLKQC